MNDGDALLAAIIANPDDDTPRLVYADWLDENDQPERAEFIRLQCAADADEAAEDRAAELEEQYRVKWLAGFPQFADAVWEFRRGFPEVLDIYVELLLERYDAFARVPWLRTLLVNELHNSEVRDFTNRPWSPRWTELKLQAHPTGLMFETDYDQTPALAAIANCSQAAQLRRLTLWYFDLSPEGVTALAESPYLEHLQSLRLGLVEDPDLTLLRERFGHRLVIG